MTTTDLAHDDVGHGDAIVFLHGLTCDRSNWTPAVDLLTDRFRCLNVDLPGHGDSPRTGAYDVFSQAAAVAAFLEAKQLDRPLVVGHSYGAFIATLVGTMAPVRGVVNVDQEMDTAAFKARLTPIEAQLRGDEFEEGFAAFVATLDIDRIPVERRGLVTMRPDREVVLGVWETVFDTPAADLVAMVEPALAAYEVPYLAIFGSKISAEERRLLELIPHVEIDEWDGLGHFVMLSDPARTASRLAEFSGTTAV